MKRKKAIFIGPLAVAVGASDFVENLIEHLMAVTGVPDRIGVFGFPGVKPVRNQH